MRAQADEGHLEGKERGLGRAALLAWSSRTCGLQSCEDIYLLFKALVCGTLLWLPRKNTAPLLVGTRQWLPVAQFASLAEAGAGPGALQRPHCPWCRGIPGRWVSSGLRHAVARPRDFSPSEACSASAAHSPGVSSSSSSAGFLRTGVSLALGR